MPMALVPALAEAGTMAIAVAQSTTMATATVFLALVLMPGFCNPPRRRSERAASGAGRHQLAVTG